MVYGKHVENSRLRATTKNNSYPHYSVTEPDRQVPAGCRQKMQTADYVTTGDLTQALAGNGPILVSKLTGTVEVAGTVLPVEVSVRNFEASTAQSAWIGSGQD
jgi:hypothetical protein